MKSFPNWYWKKGLHDAEIKKISFQFLDYDYTLANPIRNYLLVELDSCNAMFETKITSIKFYNAKIIAGKTDISGYWWVYDELICNKGKYTLLINARSVDQKVSIHISFDNADVFRHSD